MSRDFLERLKVGCGAFSPPGKRVTFISENRRRSTLVHRRERKRVTTGSSSFHILHADQTEISARRGHVLVAEASVGRGGVIFFLPRVKSCADIAVWQVPLET